MIIVIALIIVCIKLASEAVQRRRTDVYATQQLAAYKSRQAARNAAQGQ